jgi:hypothetical protein
LEIPYFRAVRGNFSPTKLICFEQVRGFESLFFRGGLFSYVGEFAKQYFLEAGHDGAPNEIEADKGEEVFKDFNRYVNSHFGKDSLINLMNTTENTHGYFGTDEYKIRMINIYWNSYQDSKNEK